ncbi:hypothetical protein HDU78_003561 [Chytriomyces hyalinus]|nr:hypothetical protein HDU78_003561 [Chytriomyces hyalinus]KAJ3258130.1 hypothetical protein HDU77_002411 [Chytriomyces hyalinus]KAJ3400318.1 hypothetical protein HDU80_007085 [Chytriomyces hyalinus]
MPNDRRPDLDRLGLFTEASYISTMEPFATKKSGDGTLVSRGKGKQFQTSPNKRGHDTRDVYFDKQFIRLFENEPYTDLVVLRRRYRIAGKEKNITTMPFKPSSVPPKPSGSGSVWGTIEQQYPLPNKGKNLELRPPVPKQKPESKPNFLTKPPKKGSGYGYPNVTIGHSYEYVSEPYDTFMESERKDRRDSKKKMVGERPFISSSARLDFFNAFAGLIGNDKTARATSPKKLEKSHQMSNPFKPSSCCGYTINKYPVFEAPTGSKKESEKPPKKLAPIFRPSGINKCKSYPVRSIIEATCPIAAPKWLQDIISKNVVALQRS